MVSIISFVANTVFFVDLEWIVLYISGKSITNNNTYNEYNYNPADIKIHCIFAWLLITADVRD